MDGLNNSVITGKCSGCAAYKEKIARLEGERDAAIERGVQAVWLADKLTARYVGHSARCRHLKCFTAALGLIVEHCVACEAEAAERDAAEQRALRIVAVEAFLRYRRDQIDPAGGPGRRATGTSPRG